MPAWKALPQEVCHAPSHEEQYRPGPELSTFIHDHHMHIKTFHSHNDDDAPLADIDIELKAAHHMDETEIISQLLAMKGIKQATFHVDDGSQGQENYGH